METFWQDLRYGGRALVKNPGFAIVPVLALSLGIGANTAIFSLVNSLLLKPLPYNEPEKLVIVWEDASFLGFPQNTPAVANYVDWKKENQVFKDMAALRGGSFNLTGAGEPEKLDARAVTANFFSVLGVSPAAGRVFLPEEDKPGAPKVALISHGLWLRRFGGASDLVGKSISLDGEKCTVIGIMPKGFEFPEKGTDLWVPAAFSDRDLANRGAHYLRVVARLKPGISMERARSDMETIARRLQQDFPETNENLGIVLVPLREQLLGETRPALVVLLAAVGCVLLIACANIANLLLARAAGRSKEIAVRTALGAGRLRLVRQLVTESLLLAALGGMTALFLASWSFGLLRNFIPAVLSGTVTLSLDHQVLAFNLLLSLCTGVVFGLAPALSASKVDLNHALKQGGGRSGVGAGHRGLRNFLVMAEVALSLVLLIGAGLLIQSFARMRGLDPGFNAQNLLTLRTELPRSRYSDLPNRITFYEQVLQRVQALPGVVTAGYSSFLPLTNRGGTNGFTIEGQPAPKPGEHPDANYRQISAAYLRTLGIPLRMGRHFDARDGPRSPLVGIINETMSRQFWPNQNPLGRRLKLGDFDSDAPWVTIVGVAGDVRQMGLDIAARAEMYFPYQQCDQVWAMPRDLAIRTKIDPMGLVAAVRREISAADKDQPVSNVKTMEEIVDNEVSDRRLQTWLLTGFAALALLLASAGIYGVLAYAVTQRTQEIGVRMALGARRSDVLRLIFGYGMSLAGLGVVAGVAISLAMTRMMSSLLFGITATDPSTFTAVALLLLGVALASCYIPARRATRVDPMVALRYE